MDALLKNLNPKQKEAVLNTEGPILILAGPGSGKTKTLVHRVAYLLKKGVLPENIMAVTFTNKAADEMTNRITQICNYDHSRTISTLPFIGTFHALAVRILRAHASQIDYLKNFSIFDEDDTLTLLKEIMKELEINPKQFPAGMISNTISRLKNELVTPELYGQETDLNDIFPKNVHGVWNLYQKRLREANAMDFDDLLLNVYLLFKKHPRVLEEYQNKFQYINVDEWQDTNLSQYTLISMLAGKYRNIAVVGDDAQAIYSFRGADYRNISNFEKDWPDAKIILLDQNYRSTQTILNAACQVISRNSVQKEKGLWTERKGGECLEMASLENEKEEAGFVLRRIRELLKKGHSLKDMVILYRTNTQSRAFEEEFLKNNLPYKIIGGIKFYQRKEVKDILAYVRFLMNPSDLLSLKRIINTPARGIGKMAFLGYLNNYRSGIGTVSDNKTEPTQKFDQLICTLKNETKNMRATRFLKTLLKSIRYQEYLNDSSNSTEERWENIQELVNLAQKYDDLEPPAGLEKLMEDVALMSDTMATETKGSPICMMTLHAAKGLEFPIVFMVGMEEGIFPHSRSLFNPQELEEERRLCYVGLTRAKDKVFLSFALRRARFGSIQANSPSRFLTEIPEHLLETKGDKTIRQNSKF